MTRAQIAAMIAGFGVPNAFGHFDDENREQLQGPAYIYFSYTDRADFHADGINYVKIAELTIELCTTVEYTTAAPDFALQNDIEAALTAQEMTFEQPDQEYDDGEQVYITTYTTEVLLTDA